MCVSAFDKNQASEDWQQSVCIRVTVAVMHLTWCLPWSLPSRYNQTMPLVRTRKHAPSQIPHPSLDAWDRFETVGPGQAALCCNWVPRHLEIHVTFGHMGCWAKWHQCPTSWVDGCRGERGVARIKCSRFEKQSVRLVNYGQSCHRLHSHSAVLQLWIWQHNTQLVQMVVFNVSRWVHTKSKPNLFQQCESIQEWCKHYITVLHQLRQKFFK